MVAVAAARGVTPESGRAGREMTVTGTRGRRSPPPLTTPTHSHRTVPSTPVTKRRREQEEETRPKKKTRWEAEEVQERSIP